LSSTFRKGLIVGFSTIWDLGKIIFPVTLILSILQHTPVISFITDLITPLMRFIGLSGETAIVLVLGNVLNLYAAIGAIISMSLTCKEVFILAVMLSLSHNLIVETAITTKIGVKPWVAAGLRLGMAIAFAYLINFFWQGGQDLASYGILAQNTAVANDWPSIIVSSIKIAATGILQMSIIVIPIMIVIQLLKDINVLQKLSGLLQPFTNVLGLNEKTGITLLAGILFGIAYGAGVIIQTAKEENLSKKDLYLATFFLISCHAVIEDTLIFIPLGINVLYLLLIRMVLACIITISASFIWNKIDLKKSYNCSNNNNL